MPSFLLGDAGERAGLRQDLLQILLRVPEMRSVAFERSRDNSDRLVFYVSAARE